MIASFALQHAEELLLTDKLERDYRAAAVDRERRVRILAEDEAEVTVGAAEAARARESLVAREEAQALQAASDQNRRWCARLARPSLPGPPDPFVYARFGV
eukprot:86634-Prorocentrum_minimum.AAC.3